MYEYAPVVALTAPPATSIVSPPVSVCIALTVASIGDTPVATAPAAVPLVEVGGFRPPDEVFSEVTVSVVTTTPVTTAVACPLALSTRS